MPSACTVASPPKVVGRRIRPPPPPATRSSLVTPGDTTGDRHVKGIVKMRVRGVTAHGALVVPAGCTFVGASG